MKIYICERVYENFDLKDPLDMQFLSDTEGNLYMHILPYSLSFLQMLRSF